MFFQALKISMDKDTDPACDYTGICKSPDYDQNREISNCIFCGPGIGIYLSTLDPKNA